MLSTLQPHESSSETRYSLSNGHVEVVLQPHESSSETRSPDGRRMDPRRFNLTRVRLKLFEDFTAEGDGQSQQELQPHESSSETRRTWGHTRRHRRASTSREFV